MSREKALEKKFIQINGPKIKGMVNLDFDMEDAEWFVKTSIYDDGLLPEPNIITVNPNTGGVHITYGLDGFLGTSAGLWRYKRTFTAIQACSGSDTAYNGDKRPNPLHAFRSTEFLHTTLTTLKELDEFVTFEPQHRYTKKNPLPEVGRNNILFNKLSSWAYREWKFDNFSERLIQEAENMNTEFALPLRLNEVHSIAKSIEKFIVRNFSKEVFSTIQKHRSNRRWQGQGEKTRTEILMMLEVGMKAKDISGALGLSMDATYKAISRARKG